MAGEFAAFVPAASWPATNVAAVALQAGLLLFIVVVATASLASGYLLFGGRLGEASAYAILGLGWIAGAVAARRLVPAPLLATLPLAITIATASLLLSHQFIDLTVDGQGYHFVAVRALADGWNPYRDTPIDYWSRWPGLWPASASPLHDRALHYGAEWANYFPKLAWIYAATHVAAGFSIEASKALNPTLLAASFLCAFGALGALNFGWVRSGAMAAALAGSPVATGELFSRMNDGALFTLCLIFLVTGLFGVWRRDVRFAWVAGGAVLLALNLKFSAIPLFGCLCAALCGVALLTRGWRYALTIAAPLLICAALALVVFGYAPYVRNLLEHGHPLFPALGPGAVDIMRDASAAQYDGASPWTMLAHSLFSESSVSEARLKLPFSVRGSELNAIGPDVWAGGFGPLFSGALLLGAAIGLAHAARDTLPRPVRWSLLVLVSAILISSLAQPANYLARYVPAVWLIPGILAVSAIGSKGRFTPLLGWACAVALIVGAAIGAVGALRVGHWGSQQVRAQIQTFKATGRTACLKIGGFPNRVEHFEAAGVPIRTFVRALPSDCTGERAIPFTLIRKGDSWSWGRGCTCAQP